MNKLLLIDGHSILNRAFYGLPDLTNDKGLHTNAVYGFLNIMFKMIEEEKPTHLAVAFDVSAPTFRHEIYKEYKGTRKPAPDEFRQQVPLMKEVLNAMGILTREKPGLEADDILGTFAKRAEANGFEVALVSGDRDLLQIASEHIKIRNPKTVHGKTTVIDYYAKDVLNEYQVTPKQFIELKALMGDSSDNIPGVPGVGPKTATELMVTYGSLQGIYDHIDEISKKALKEKLANNKDKADLSLVLATINIDADIDTDFDKAVMGNIFTTDAYKLFQDLGFRNLLSRFDSADKDDKDAEEIASGIKEIDDKTYKALINELVTKPYVAVKLGFSSGGGRFQEKNGQLSLFETISDDRSLAVTLCYEDDIYYIDNSKADIDGIIDGLRTLYYGDCIVVTHNIKDYYLAAGICDEYASDITKHIVDEALMEYLLNPLTPNPEVGIISKAYAGLFIPESDINFKKESLADILASKKDSYKVLMGLYAYGIYHSYNGLVERLKNDDMYELLLNIEMPTSYVLYSMEKEGILVKKDELKEYGENLISSIGDLEKRIYEQAGQEFNINSPKQLGEILFEKMGLPGGKKTKTGYSTSAEVLEGLQNECPMVKDILEYRTITKLKSTFVDSLGEYIGDDGRIHSNFNQTITATGRISSNDPNLQNIPTRLEIGRKIRKVFVPREGYVFCDADYSQVELRILAALSEDETLINAYKEGKDIHTLTASLVFNVPFDEVTSNMRRNAKAVNFGIVYGISSFGLSQDIGISREEAKQYIENYFKTYPGIKNYLDKAKEDAKELGYSKTIYGRRRPIPELKNSNFMQRSFGERVAMNAPIQGTAADVMKLAMIRVFDAIKKENLKSRMILQVHDELMIETSIDEKDKVLEILEREMSGAAELSVRLEVSSSVGNNWYEAK